MRHLRAQHNSHWSCPRCNQQFTRHDNYTLHERICRFKISGKRPLDQDDVPSSSKRHCDDVRFVGGALDGAIQNFRIDLQRK